MIVPSDVEVALERGALELHHVGLAVGVAAELGLVAIRADVEHVRLGALLRAQHLRRVLRHQVGDLARRIIEIAEHARPPDAGLHAGRHEVLRDAVKAEGALVDDVGDRRIGAVRGQHEACVVRARRHAGAAADATLVALQHEATILDLVGRLHGTGAHAGRIVAVVAQPRQELLLDRGILADNLVGHPGAIDAQWRVVLRLARDLAGHAADAAARVDDHGEAALARLFPGLDRRDPELFTHVLASSDVATLVLAVPKNTRRRRRLTPLTFSVIFLKGSYFPNIG